MAFYLPFGLYIRFLHLSHLYCLKVISRYNGEEYKIKLEREAIAWIAIYPKFGEITAAIKGGK